MDSQFNITHSLLLLCSAAATATGMAHRVVMALCLSFCILQEQMPWDVLLHRTANGTENHYLVVLQQELSFSEEDDATEEGRRETKAMANARTMLSSGTIRVSAATCPTYRSSSHLF